MRNFLKIASGINVMPLVLALQRQPELFGRNPQRTTTPGTPHREATDIWVRSNDPRPFIESGDWTGFNDPHESTWSPEALLIPQVRPIVFDLMRLVEGEKLGGILITKLAPGNRIAPHVDEGWHAGHYDKYYVALQNEPGSNFAFEGPEPHPSEWFSADSGDVYWFRNDVRHWIVNNSAADRLSMIVTIRHAPARA